MASPGSTPPPTDAPKTEAALLNEAVPLGAPEKYELKAPEGVVIPESASNLFKDMNLSNDQAQKFVDYYMTQVQEQQKAANGSALAIRESWRAQVKADPDIGPRLPAVRQTISSALDVIGDAKLSQQFREAMDFTGAGDNPAFVKTLYKLAQMVTEPRRHVQGGPSPEGQKRPGQGPPSAAKALYPNLA